MERKSRRRRTRGEKATQALNSCSSSSSPRRGKRVKDDLLASTSVDVNHKSEATSMDAYSKLAAIDVDDMASRGRLGVPTREGEQRRDEPRREDQGEQQAPAPQGLVLPPPSPVDYGVFLQGLVQAMQTHAHTQAALQAQLEAQAQVPAPQADHGGPSIMERFKRMSPPSFKGESDLLLAESWMREIEKIFRAIRCTEDDKVTLATYMLQERADVWWSSLMRTRFEDGAVEALSAACRQEGEMEQYLEEKKASQKRPAAPFQRQERKKATFQSPQCLVASGSGQVPSQRSPNGKKECPHCGRAHGGTECWKLAGKCLKCGSSEHRIKDCPRLQQGVRPA
ncbi:hypothetical protein Taro_008440 [Colocasia esculenta]|uniref:CCHC-type domain-containing protein n=1 Tax=Colocasia esculenta TaxID=4460 RepID=A0A843U3E4_COLES|nr:hypothetical protein [Colocasia esculenta]